ncbi:MAG: polyphenol oxidase family protein [Myxococcota bacterium]
MSPAPLAHPLLTGRRVAHGFGLRGSAAPPGIRRPRQVHGAGVVDADQCGGPEPPAADAVVCAAAGVPVGILTADCVPILLASSRGSAVAAIHAGWRGLARGVVAAGVDALRGAALDEPELVAAIGPHIGPCCYEVDDPVLDALSPRFARDLEGALRPARAGHALLDLGALVRLALVTAGLAASAVGALPDACTRCDRERFHSYRRDGPRAGRLVHFIAARSREG